MTRRLPSMLSCLVGSIGICVWSASCFGQDGSLLRDVTAQTNNRLANQQIFNPNGSPAQSPTNPQSSPNTNMPGGLPAAVQNYPPGVMLQDASWYFQPPTPSRVYRKNDIVTIRVDEISRMTAEGNSEARRNTLYDAVINDWLKIESLDTIKPARQADGDPRVQSTTNQLYRADASLESRQSMTFNIAARIVDVRPNGDLVLEARKTIVFNENVWETSLSGICRPIDIAADNVVLSRDLLDLQIQSKERGRLRDGYKRGWFSRFVDMVSPF
ncbi:flagellar basal body L-ring protein FlgH [Planctomycetaceae bacterium SH139]